MSRFKKKVITMISMPLVLRSRVFSPTSLLVRSCGVCLLNVALSGCVSGIPGTGDADVPTISTVVGNGLAGQNGDGLAPKETALYLPQDTTVGPDGNLYILDWNNHRVRRVINDTVETVAGTGELGNADPGMALTSQFNHPTNVAFDDQGRMIIAAWHNSKIMRVDLATGVLELVAGTGGRSFGGDGGPAAMAILDLPSSVAVTAAGEILVSDQANFRIRRIDPDGSIFTICGDGMPAYTGDGGEALTARLNAPKGQSAPPAGRITLTERDEIIIADTGNHAIRMIDAAGQIQTIAGTGTAGYSGDGGPATEAQLNTPSDVAVGSDGSIYIADTMNHVIRVITPDGMMDTFAGTGERGFDGDGGPAADALLDRPYGVEADRTNGDVYIADTHNQRIRRVSTRFTPDDTDDNDDADVTIVPCTDQLGSICTYAGTGQFGFDGDGQDRLQTALYWPFDMEFLTDGRQIVLDWNNHKVREILPDDTFATIMGSDFVGDGPRDLADLTEPGARPETVDLNHPTDIQEMPDGDVLIVAWHNHKLRVIDADSGRVLVLSGAGVASAMPAMPGPGDGGRAADARYNQPAHAVLDPAGNLFLVDQRNQRIRVLYDFATARREALVATVVGTGTKGYNGDGLAGLATDLSFPAGGNPEPTGGLARDADGVFYLSDTHNNRIRRIEFRNDDFTDSIVTTIAGTGAAGYSGDGGLANAAEINFPQDLEIGPDGHLYFADANNNVIRRIDLTSGIIDTVVGTGTRGYTGDGGQAVDAQLNRPFGVAFDADGDLYVSDTFNSRVRKVVLSSD
ncbi:MAG: hypothetical protein HOP29_09035 [Phycisphaerales bacterium]|nr:hypothetical protein [Phycisphaerales bacterium]